MNILSLFLNPGKVFFSLLIFALICVSLNKGYVYLIKYIPTSLDQIHKSMCLHVFFSYTKAGFISPSKLMRKGKVDSGPDVCAGISI